MRRFLVLLVLTMLATACLPYQHDGWIAILDTRTEAGLHPLHWSEEAEAYAQERAERLAANDRLEHLPMPEHGLGWLPDDWAMLGENVGVTNLGSTPDELHDAFLASPLHADNLMRTEYTHVGIGVAENDWRRYVVHIFWG